jgi:DNA-binding NarL/FixJ family response regulator
MIRVLIADDHTFVRQGLERLIATWEGVEVVGAAADGAEAVSLYTRTAPDVVLMDLGMAGELDGIEATRRIMERHPGARIVILTSHPDREHVERALAAGAVGYVLKHAASDDIERAVCAAARGESPVDPKIAHLLINRSADLGPVKDLSSREREVLQLVARGMPNKLIARKLAITERTVKGHLTSIYRQIGVTDRLQAALFLQSNDPRSSVREYSPSIHDAGGEAA